MNRSSASSRRRSSSRVTGRATRDTVREPRTHEARGEDGRRRLGAYVPTVSDFRQRNGPRIGPAEYLAAERVAAEYVARADRLAPLFQARARPLPAELHPRASLALELRRSLLYGADGAGASDNELWNGKPQQYFESMNYADQAPNDDEYDSDSLAP